MHLAAPAKPIFTVVVALSDATERRRVEHVLKSALVPTIERRSFEATEKEIVNQLWEETLFLCSEDFGSSNPDGGVQLAEALQTKKARRGYGSWPKMIVCGSARSQLLIDRVQLAGAEYIPIGYQFGLETGFDVLIRQVLSIRDELEILAAIGPRVLARHTRSADESLYCTDAEKHRGFSLLYGTRDKDLSGLGRPETAVLDWKLRYPYPEDAGQIVDGINGSSFYRRILAGHQLKESALAMIMTRIRDSIDLCLTQFTTMLVAADFLPRADKVSQKYLFKSRPKIIHVPPLP
jgi:hypothetical protein